MEWISVGDKLPDSDKDVLFYNDEFKNVELGHFCGNQWFPAWAEHKIDGSSVTHWMPLPNPPNSQEM